MSDFDEWMDDEEEEEKEKEAGFVVAKNHRSIAHVAMMTLEKWRRVAQKARRPQRVDREFLKAL